MNHGSEMNLKRWGGGVRNRQFPNQNGQEGATNSCQHGQYIINMMLKPLPCIRGNNSGCKPEVKLNTCSIKIVKFRLNIGSLIQCVVSYRDQCTHKHTS